MAALTFLRGTSALLPQIRVCNQRFPRFVSASYFHMFNDNCVKATTCRKVKLLTPQLSSVENIAQGLSSPSSCPECGKGYCRTFSTKSGNESQGQLVYKGRVGNMFKALKLFSLTTSTIGLCLQPYLLITYQDMPLSAAIPFFGAINVFVFMNPILIHYVSKKYVKELYFNPSTKVFTAVVMTFFAREQKISFTAEDVHVPDVPSVFAMLTVKGRPLFVHEADFTSIEIYKHLMGFDKPIDLSYVHKDKKDEVK